LTKFKNKNKKIGLLPGNKLIKFLAPASTHNFASFFIFSNITMDGACLLLRAFLSFQISEVKKQSEQSDGFARWRPRHVKPPLVKKLQMLLLLIDRSDPKPLLNEGPNPYGEPTMHKEVCRRFRDSLA
jgi:hypothetical protein